MKTKIIFFTILICFLGIYNICLAQKNEWIKNPATNLYSLEQDKKVGEALKKEQQAKYQGGTDIALIAMELLSPDESKRINAVDYLTYLIDNPYIKTIEEMLLNDPSDGVKQQCAKSLHCMNSNNSIPVLVMALRTGNTQLKMEIALALAALGEKTESIKILEELGKSDDRNISMKTHLGYLDLATNEAVKLLKAGLINQDSYISVDAAIMLTQLGYFEESFPILKSKLQDQDGTIRMAALRGLAYCGTDSAIQLIKEASDDSDVLVSKRAFMILMNCNIPLSSTSNFENIRTGYDPNLAAQYGNTWCNSRNPAYYDYSNSGGDCANFVSQCLIAGYLDLSAGINDGFGSIPSCDNLHSFLYNDPNVTNYLRKTSSYPTWWTKGDVVIMGTASDYWQHSMFAVTSNAPPLLDAHSNDRCLYSITAFPPTGFTSCDFYHISANITPVPVNDECPGAIQLTVSSSCNYTPGTTIGATSTGFASCSGNMNDDDVFYNFNTGSKTSVTIQVNSLSNFDAAVQVLTGPCSLSMYQVPNGCIDVTAHGGLESRTFTGLSTNTTYYIRIGSYDAGSSNQGNFQVCVFGNEGCTNWSVSPTSANYTSSGGSGSFSVYASGSCTFSAASSVSWINNIYYPGSGVVEYDVDANPNCSSQTGYVNIYDENNVLKVAHTVNQSGLPSVTPTISISPSPNTTVCSGNPLSFTSTITNGGITPSYQWFLNGNQVGTNSTYTTPSLTSNSTVYCKLTSNANCANPATVNSSTTTITVTPPVVPTITISPAASTTICSGNPVLFTSTITNGGSTPTYQWFLNGNQVGTNSTYTTPSLTSNSTVYCKLTSNANCANPATVNSSTTSITVNPVPGTSTINGPNSGTAGVAINFTAFSNNANIYNWTAPSDWTPTTGVGQSFSSTPGSSGNVTVTPSNDCGIGPQGNLFVTIPNSVFVLTINSQNPSAGVNITVTPNDNNGSGDGTTPLTRSYYQGTGVTLTAPPSANGNNFSKWLKNNADFSTNHQIPITVTANDTYTAVYSNPPCSLSVTPPTQNVPAIGGSVSFNVTSLSGCNWTVVSNKTWCVVSPSTGSGNGNFTATCIQNSTGITQTADITVTITGITPVIVTVTQSAVCTPSWQLAQYLQFNMQVIGQLYLFNELTSNPSDLIGAFVGDECRGIGHPDQNTPGYVFLTILSDINSGETITFKAWNSEQCEECPISETLQFENQALIGDMTDPFEFHCGLTELCINFGAGFTWFSVNVDPGGLSINNVFNNISPCQNDRIIGQQSFATYWGTQWVGSLNVIDPMAMYKMKLCSSQTWCKEGFPVEVSPMTIGSGYPWIGYLPQSDLPINVALENLDPDPLINDRFTGQGAFAVYSGTQWVGTLSTLQKGKGFIIHLANPSTLIYPSGIDSKEMVFNNEAEILYSPLEDDVKVNSLYNMQLIGNILLPDGRISTNTNDAVYAYVGEECRGIAYPFSEPQGALFLTIGSDIDQGEVVNFKVFIADENRIYEIPDGIEFSSETEIGTVPEPYIFNLSGLTGIPNPLISNNFKVGEIYPNPFEQSATLQFEINEPGKVKVEIFNVFGSVVNIVINKDMENGSYVLELDANNLQTGIYTLLFTYIEDQTPVIVVRKMIIK